MRLLSRAGKTWTRLSPVWASRSVSSADEQQTSTLSFSFQGMISLRRPLFLRFPAVLVLLFCGFIKLQIWEMMMVTTSLIRGSSELLSHSLWSDTAVLTRGKQKHLFYCVHGSFKGALWTLLQHIKLYLHPLLSNKTHCLYSWGLYDTLNAFLSS